MKTKRKKKEEEKRAQLEGAMLVPESASSIADNNSD